VKVSILRIMFRPLLVKGRGSHSTLIISVIPWPSFPRPILGLCLIFSISTATLGSMTMVVSALVVFSSTFFSTHFNVCTNSKLRWSLSLGLVRCRVGHLFFFKGLFVFSNLFGVRNRGTRSRHLVYWSKNHKYDFMHKMTSLELGLELRYILKRC
jgi:hypothetical protein